VGGGCLYNVNEMIMYEHFWIWKGRKMHNPQSQQSDLQYFDF